MQPGEAEGYLGGTERMEVRAEVDAELQGSLG